MEKITVEFVNKIFDNAEGKTIAVIGDIMLDRFFWGSVSRISPEAPVPVVDVEKESFHLGGAANVANNLNSLGLHSILYGVIGKDDSGEKFVNIANKIGIDTKGLYFDTERPTTVKTRIIGNNQHLVRLDREQRKLISDKAEKSIINSITSEKDLSGIVFGDYDKGTISENLISNITNFANKNNIPIYVDPKFKNFFHYKKATFFKPNRKEASTALNMQIENDDDIIQIGKNLIEILEAKNILLTLGSKGMMLFEENGNISSVPTIARSISDVSGAGDTAIATLSAAIAGGAKGTEAAMIANYASGAVCELPGVVSITKNMINNAIKKRNNLSLKKINSKR